jgi:hypothetical protein
MYHASYRKPLVSGKKAYIFPCWPDPENAACHHGLDRGSKSVQPDPGNDGISFVGYKVTSPAPGVYHYEHASITISIAVSILYAWAPEPISVTSDFMRRLRNLAGQTTARLIPGLQSTPWAVTQAVFHNLEQRNVAQNQNANAIGLALYNFRFDADQPPQSANATVGFFKTGSPTTVAIQAPAGSHANTDAGLHRTPTATATSTATATATATATSTATATATATSTPSATSTPRPSPTPRGSPPPRPRPTPPPRP